MDEQIQPEQQEEKTPRSATKKIAVVLLALVAAGGLLYLLFQYAFPSPTVETPTKKELITYANSEYGFSVDYPDNLQPGIKTATGNESFKIWFSVSGPQKLAAGTLVISVSSDTSACATQPKSEHGAIISSMGTKTLSDVPFLYYTRIDPVAGEGRFVVTHTYAASRGNACYTLSNALSGMTKEGNSAPDIEKSHTEQSQVSAILDPIVRSFYFAP